MSSILRLRTEASLCPIKNKNRQLYRPSVKRREKMRHIYDRQGGGVGGFCSMCSAPSSAMTQTIVSQPIHQKEAGILKGAYKNYERQHLTVTLCTQKSILFGTSTIFFIIQLIAMVIRSRTPECLETHLRENLWWICLFHANHNAPSCFKVSNFIILLPPTPNLEFSIKKNIHKSPLFQSIHFLSDHLPVP